MRTARPCAWVEGRGEGFLATTHGRDQVQYVELAARRDGRITGLRARIVADVGAYAMGMGPGVPAINTGTSISGPYDIANVECEVVGVYTNRMPTGPYRGAGHPEATFLIERMVDELARELGRDPVEVRKANLVPAAAMPHKLTTGCTLDSGRLRRDDGRDALALAGYAGLRDARPSCARRGSASAWRPTRSARPRRHPWRWGRRIGAPATKAHAWSYTPTVMRRSSPAGRAPGRATRQPRPDRG